MLTLLAAGLLTSTQSIAQQDKTKRPSPPDSVTQTLNNGLTITVNYSKPSVKGRTMGKELAPFGKVWRTGANEATWMEFSRDAMVEGKSIAAGKYGLYTIPGEDEWTIIFNKVWNQWGTRYNEPDDMLRVKVKPSKAKDFAEQLTFDINKKGVVSLNWANTKVDFKVK